MTKVCFIANPAWPHVEKWSKYFIAQPGYEIHIISAQRPHFEGAVWHDLGRMTKGLLPWTVATMLAHWKIFKSIRPDVVHIHNVDSSFFPLLKVWDGPLVVTAYGLDMTLPQTTPDAGPVRKRKVALLQRANVVTAASRFLLDVALTYADLPPESGMVTPFGVELGAFQPIASDEKKTFTLGFFKDLKPEYGPLEFLAALERVRARHSEVRAIMVGPGPLQGDIVSAISSPSLAGAVEYHERVPHAQMPEMYGRIDLCIMPSRQESFGVVALEAQAMKVPVIATRVEGLPEVVVDGTTGLLLDDNDPARLADAIVGLLSDPERRMAMGEAGRKFVERNFSLEVNGEVMEEAYRRAMRRA